MTKILITGIAGFVGSHLAELVRATTDWEILTHVKKHAPDYVVHLGARTDIEGSLRDPGLYVHDNIVGTLDLLDSLDDLEEIKQFVYFSTDEVFGPMVGGKRFKEWDRHNPQNPYAATKSAAEELCLAFAKSYGLPMLVTYSMNLIGEGQPVKKFLPTVVRCAMTGEPLQLYTNEVGDLGYRDYLHASDAAHAVLFLLQRGPIARDKINIAREEAISPLYLIERVEKILGKKINVERVVAGTQFSGLDGSKLHALGWHPPFSFEFRLESTVKWLVTYKGWRDKDED